VNFQTECRSFSFRNDSRKNSKFTSSRRPNWCYAEPRGREVGGMGSRSTCPAFCRRQSMETTSDEMDVRHGERPPARPPALSPVTRQSPPQDLQADCCRSFPAVCIPSRITSRGRLCRSNSDAMESTVIAPFRARIPFVTYDASRPLAKVKFTFSKRLFIQTREK